MAAVASNRAILAHNPSKECLLHLALARVATGCLQGSSIVLTSLCTTWLAAGAGHQRPVYWQCLGRDERTSADESGDHRYIAGRVAAAPAVAIATVF